MDQKPIPRLLEVTAVPAYRLTAPYKSTWYTVLLPTLIALGVWAGVLLGGLALLGWNAPGWLGMLLCFGGFVPGLAVAAATYRFLLRLAERGRGELALEGDRLRWRAGRRWREIDFARPHEARIAAGTSGLGQPSASVTFYPGGEIIHLKNAGREDVLAVFPEPYFVDELTVLPEEGLWGFEFTADDPVAMRFFTALLECLWRNRQQNERFRLYQKFPWHRRSRPAFHHIRLIDLKRATPEEQAFLENLKAQVVSSLGDVEATPDYLVGWLYRSLRSELSGLPDSCAVMPLGYITAEVSFPRPGRRRFTIDRFSKEVLAEALGATPPTDGPYLQDKRYLYVRGHGGNGTPLELAFDWYGPENPGYEESRFIVRFVGAMREQARESRDWP